MSVTVEITGLNLERMMTLAACSGVVLRHIRRMDERRIQARVFRRQQPVLVALCARGGWEIRISAYSPVLRLFRWLKMRPSVPAGALLFVLLMLASSRIIWRIDIVDAGKAVAEVRRCLEEAGIRPGKRKASVSLAALRGELQLCLPDLAYVSAGYEGSTLVVDCQPALEGERALSEGAGYDLVAAQDGVVTRMAVYSGTPVVKVGQAVRQGDVLIRGEERTKQQGIRSVPAQGDVMARVWARADAKAARTVARTVETGHIRRRVTLCTPWNSRLVRDAQPYASQDVSIEKQPVVGLYLPLWREIETLAETVVIEEPRSESDAAGIAQGAAQQLAKNKCPPGVHILDKSVKYSMIDNEFVYATVVLEYESSIGVREMPAVTGP